MVGQNNINLNEVVEIENELYDFLNDEDNALCECVWEIIKAGDKLKNLVKGTEYDN